MLLGLKELDRLKVLLDDFIKEQKIYKYRIYLNLNTTLSVDIVADENSNTKEQIENSNLIDISIDEWISIDEYENDKYYQKLFEKKIDKEHRRRLSNLIDNKKYNHKNKTPIISFYSYKGGVGRTTSLITFANYYAYHHAKKVVILDFDFEAPGVTNFFDFSLDELKNKSGVVEYILDKEASKEKLNLEKNYMIEVSNEFSKDGSIYVIPAGNLFGEDNLDSYIEALSRIDINSTDTIVNQINSLIDDINETINPDVILIDSRTGFNDIFGFLINKISNVIVGLFEDSIQTKPGLKLFLKEIYTKNQNNINSIIVNSLVHKDSINKKRKSFKDNVHSYITELTEETYAPNIFDLRNNSILGDLGTVDYDKEDYIEFISEFTPPDYQKFFNRVIELIELKVDNSKDENINDKEIKKYKSITTNKKVTVVKKNNVEQYKKELLEKISDDKNYPKKYAEDIDYNDNFLNKKFYFRKSMEDIFNFDKFLLMGTKGTGKTAFYLALRDERFLNTLKIKANKKQIKFTAIDIISIKESQEREKYFEIDNFNKIENKDFFYKRFWTIYILNSILLSKNKLDKYNISDRISSILPIKLNSIATNKLFFEDIIKDDKKFILIEDELEKIDLHLKKIDLNLMITFDQLDYIVKPINWGEAISPLINYCRSMPYLKIQPKIFIRRDLFDKYIQLTNKQSLKSKIIDLEWSKDEVFAFFFKVVFAYAKYEFLDIMKEYNINSDNIKAIKKQIEKQNSYNQIDLDKYKIIPLVDTFFGEYPNPNTNYNRQNEDYSKSYNWFYESLADSNETISLRVFLDFIKLSIEKYFKEDTNFSKPILHPHFYNDREIRRACVENHFKDLAEEKGNEDFKVIIEHIRDSFKFPKKFKYRRIYGYKYNEFFTYFLENIELKYCKSINDIEEVLQINGAISIHYTQQSFSFAYLYKYYLGLKG